MKSSNYLKCVIALLSMSFVLPIKSLAQNQVPAEVQSIVNLKLEDGQSRLTSLGYEICASSLFGKKQDWINESSTICITVKFDKSKEKKITEVAINPALSECQKGLEASRKIWDNYHDGQAPVTSSKIDEERKKLTASGFSVSYWVNEVAPGRCAEYWVNESLKEARSIVWETAGTKWVMTNKTEYSYGHNPAPAKK
jgi:hypothetical protein